MTNMVLVLHLTHLVAYTVTDLCRTDYSWRTGIHHHLRLLNFCGEILGGRAMAEAGSLSHMLIVSHMVS